MAKQCVPALMEEKIMWWLLMWLGPRCRGAPDTQRNGSFDDCTEGPPPQPAHVAHGCTRAAASSWLSGGAAGTSPVSFSTPVVMEAYGAVLAGTSCPGRAPGRGEQRQASPVSSLAWTCPWLWGATTLTPSHPGRRGLQISCCCT
jgi:hypothetical protein